MVSKNTPSSTTSSILHHFIPSDPNSTHQIQQSLDAYISSIRCNNTPTMDLLGTAPPDNGHHTQQHHQQQHQQQQQQQQQQQRLSLSLGSQMLLSQNQHYNNNNQRTTSYNQDLVSQHYSLSNDAYSTSSLVHNVRSSKYLKPTQSLLHEVINISSNYETTCQDDDDECGTKLSFRGRRAARLSSELNSELYTNGGYLSEQKQELHLKFAKLVSLLEEVESRYERYYNQMQEVVSSFEMIAGVGSARCYTVLALRAMSKHFFSLSDAILSQINSTKRKIYKDSPNPSSGRVSSQLSLFDQDGKHNRLTLQQIGLLHGQRNAWRPIRGLPDTSVVILRAWLFEHFLHPYPTESEKLILSSQTGLSKNQVSNWFINARVRLWKPMIEEMYKDEFADSSDSDPLGVSGNGGRMVGDGECRMLHFDD